MYRTIFPSCRAGVSALLVGFCLFTCIPVSAGELVVAISAEAVSKAHSVVLDGAFALKELEAARISLRGGPPEPVIPSQCEARSNGCAPPDGAPDLSLLYGFEVPQSTNLLDAAYKLSNLPCVEWAEPLSDIPHIGGNPSYFIGDKLPSEPELGLESSDDYVVPNDPLFAEQNSLRQIHCPEAWAISTGSTQVVICAIDGGYSDDHPDLLGTMWNNPEEMNGHGDTNGFPGDIHGWSFILDTPQVTDDFYPLNGHGVSCTSIYSANSNNGEGIAGIIWNATTMVTVFGYRPWYRLGVENVIYAADNGARVSHACLGALDGYSKTARLAYEYSRSKGLLTFAASGNGSSPLPLYPAAFPSVVAVAGVDRNDAPLVSNFGHWTGVSAPLDQVVTCSPGGSYGGGGGTSAATPHAAGVAGLLLSIHPDWDCDLLEAHIKATAAPPNLEIENIAGERTGHEIGPRVDAYAALSTEPKVVFSPKYWLISAAPSKGFNQDIVELVVGLENTWQAASNVRLEMSCADPMVAVVSGQCVLGDMRPLEVKSTPESQLLLSVSHDCPENHVCDVLLEAFADGLDTPQRLDLQITLNSGIVGLDGWPNEQLDPHLYPPMRVDLNGDELPEILCPTAFGYYVFTIDGEMILEIPVIPGSSAPAVADLDGDLADELVFTDQGVEIHIFDLDLGIISVVDVEAAIYGRDLDYIDMSISIANLCGNSARQIVAIAANPYDRALKPILTCYEADGSELEGFPLDEHVQSNNVAVADFTGDGFDEIGVFASGAFYLIDHNGETLAGWPLVVEGYQHSPRAHSVEVSAGDIDGDGVPELLGVLGDDRVFAIRADGTLMPGWPFESGTARFATRPVLVDITGDGRCEIVLAEGRRFDVRPHRRGSIIHVLDRTAHELPGWPMDTGIYYLEPPIACDVNGDSRQDVIVSNSREVIAYDYTGQIVPGWPIVVAPQALGVYSYTQVSADDFDGNGTIDIGIPMEDRYFIFGLQGCSADASQWGYRGCGKDGRFSPRPSDDAPSISIIPDKRRLFAGMDSLYADVRLTNPGNTREVIAGAWIEVMGFRFYLPALSASLQAFSLTLPEHSVTEVTGLVNIPLADDIAPLEVTLGAILIDASTGEVLSCPLTPMKIERYVGPSGTIIVEGPAGACWQTFSYMKEPSSLEPSPLWVFDDGATSSVSRPGRLFTTTGEHLLGLLLTDEREGQFLVTASTVVSEQTGTCPDEMSCMGSFCMDRFEASRPDATAYDPGLEFGAAVSARGVLPWQAENVVEMVSACALAGKRLCRLSEWRAACSGRFDQTGFTYPYGNFYRQYACNDYAMAKDGVIKTGASETCVSRIGVYDMLGNVKELTTDDTGAAIYMAGGAMYDAFEMPSCQTVESLKPEPWTRAYAYGFRCCKDPE